MKIQKKDLLFSVCPIINAFNFFRLFYLSIKGKLPWRIMMYAVILAPVCSIPSMFLSHYLDESVWKWLWWVVIYLELVIENLILSLIKNHIETKKEVQNG